ncbi:tail fiber domain-containing protein [bacterium]|nr:tail fiber domain-containing protein [bacterium]
MTGGLSAGADTTILGDLALGMNTSDSTCRLALTGGTTKSEGISFGNDSYLYRVSANHLRTSGSFNIDSSLTVGGTVSIFNGTDTNKININTSDTDGVIVANTSSTTDVMSLKVANTEKFRVDQHGLTLVGSNASYSGPATQTNGKLIVGNEILNSSAIAQFDGFVRIRGGVHIHKYGSTSAHAFEYQNDTDGLKFYGAKSNFGIGISPTKPLHVYGSESDGTLAWFVNNASATDIGLSGTGGRSHLQHSGTDRFNIFVGGGSNANIAATFQGNRMGLGSNDFSPAETLHVKEGNVLIEKDAGSQLTLKNGSSNAGSILFNDGGDTGKIVYNHSDNSFTFSTNSTDRLRINSAGRVIIKDPNGTTVGAAPIIGSYLLDIQGPVVQSSNTGSSFYSLGMRRSSSTLTNPDIYDINGYGIVLGRTSSTPTLTISNSTSATDYVEGVGINMAPEGGRALTVSGHTKMYGDLTVTGNYTTVSGSVTIQDPVIQLGTPTTDTASDGYDRGCMIVYDNDNNTGTAAVSGFFGMERDSGKFVYYSKANFDAGGNNANSSTSTLGSLKMGSIEATTQIYSYGGLRVDDNAHLNAIKECSTADITTANVDYIKPLTNNRLYLRSNQITLQSTNGGRPTVSIGRDASLVNSNYDLYVNGTAFLNASTTVRDLYFAKYTGGVKPNSNSSTGNLFLMLNAGGDNIVRHATSVQIRQGLGLSDAATTSVEAIRAPLLKTAGGNLTGRLTVLHNNAWWSGGSSIIVKNAHPQGGAFDAQTGDIGVILQSHNTSASTARQFSIEHFNGEMHIRSQRGPMRIGGATVDGSDLRGKWHLSLQQHSTDGLLWSNGSAGHKIWHAGNLDPQSYGVHTLQPNYVTAGGKGFTGKTTGTVTIDQNWLNYTVRKSKNSGSNTTGTVWSTETHGAESGLHADILDGLHASSFIRADSKSTFRIGFAFTTSGGSGAGTTSTRNPWNHYAVYREGATAGDNPYRSQVDGFKGPSAGHGKLAINWHRGIVYRAHPGYGGHQFYRDTYNHSNLDTLAFSVGRGDVHVRTHGSSVFFHRDDNGTQYKYLHEGNMGQLVNANTFDGSDSVDFLKKQAYVSDGESGNTPMSNQSWFTQKRNGFWNTGHIGYSGQMLSWGTDSGSCSRVQVWSHYNNDSHWIRTAVDNNRWRDWTRIWTSNSLKNLSQLSNDRNYVRCTLSSEYKMDQFVNKESTPSFDGVTANWLKFHNNVGMGLEIANDQGNQFIRFDDRNNTYRAEAHVFQARNGNNLLYVDNAKPVTASSGTGRIIMYGALEFRSHAGYHNDSDAYYLYKHRESGNKNELRLVIGDDRGHEAFSIWDSNGAGTPEFRSQYFRNDGYTELAGPLVVRNGIEARGDIWNSSNTSSHGKTVLKEWGLLNSTHNMYMEPSPGKTFYIIPTDWSQNLLTQIHGDVQIGAPSSGWGAVERGLSVYGDIKCQSTIRAGGDIVAYYSDRRLKKNLKQLNNSSEIIKKLTGYKFDWNDKAIDLVPSDLHSQPQVGLIAQDVEDVLPEAVTGNGPRDLGYKTIKYDKLIPVLIEALKEEMSKTEELEARLERLEKLISNK